MISALGLFLLPLMFVAATPITAGHTLLLAIVLVPAFWAYVVSQTGELHLGKFGIIASIVAVVSLLGAASGGVSSTFFPLLALAPIEASIRYGRKGLFIGTIMAVVGAAAIYLGAGKLFFELSATTSTQMAILGGGIYAAWLSIRLSQQQHAATDRQIEEQKRFRLITENASELVTRHDVKGITNFASPAAQKLMGLPAIQILDRGLLESVHLQDRVNFMSGLSDAIHEDKHSVQQVRLRCKNQTDQVWKWVEMTFQPAHDEQSMALVVTRDITREIDLQSELETVGGMAKEATKQQRRFFTTMSHELRTPLNAIIGFSDILKQELFGSLPHERHSEYVGLISESGQHLLNVVNDMLDMSRIGAGKYELSLKKFDITDTAKTTLNMLQPLAEKGGVTMTSSFGGELPEIYADRRAVQQILINIVSNAVKFTPAGGNVTLRIRQLGRNLKIRVTDTGIGIDPEFMSKLGEPFMQADNGRDREFEGSGLGLSVVKGLISLHGGTFDVKSTKGEGTTVTITLPLKTKDAQPVPADETQQIVHLNVADKNAAEKSVPSNQSQGDNRARVSA